MVFSLFCLKHSEIAAKRVKLEQVSANDPIHFFQPDDTEEYECLWESVTQQRNKVLRAETGDYANHAIKGSEKGKLVYHFFFFIYFLLIIYSFLTFLLLSLLWKLEKLLC